MLTVISPAKTLDYTSPLATEKSTQPELLDQSELLIGKLRKLSPPKVAELMKLSDKLANLNFGRYLDWHQPFTPENSRQAILAFKGDVYTGLEAEKFSEKEFEFAQQHLRILSGLYGVLRPLDLMQPYRLEMGTRLKVGRKDNLYQFWGDQISELLNQQLKSIKSETLVNLASDEYFKSVNLKELNAEVVTPVFKDLKSGQYKIISFFAKKARGIMASWMIRNRVDDANQLRDFAEAGYRFSLENSDAGRLVFLRDPSDA